MRIAISNIAWDVTEDEAIAALLNRHGIDAIDVAPGKYFPDPQAASTADTARVRDWWQARGIEITGMQALLFGTQGLNVFGTRESQAAMLRHLDAVCRIGGQLGATRLVFGSPKNRDRSGIDDAQALAVAVDFFRKLGDLAAGHGVVVCLEPNPECYGANFMTTARETTTVVAAVAHAAIRMQIDTGALAINDEKISELLPAHAALVGHVHVSEPNLVPVGDGGADHASYAAAIANGLPGYPVTIEMVATPSEPHLLSVARAIVVTKAAYANPGA